LIPCDQSTGEQKTTTRRFLLSPNALHFPCCTVHKMRSSLPLRAPCITVQFGFVKRGGSTDQVRTSRAAKAQIRRRQAAPANLVPSANQTRSGHSHPISPSYQTRRLIDYEYTVLVFLSLCSLSSCFYKSEHEILRTTRLLCVRVLGCEDASVITRILFLWPAYEKCLYRLQKQHWVQSSTYLTQLVVFVFLYGRRT
jgi:hypothetical protein